MLTRNGLFVLNVSNHIRNGEEVPVVEWHLETFLRQGFGRRRTSLSIQIGCGS